MYAVHTASKRLKRVEWYMYQQPRRDRGWQRRSARLYVVAGHDIAAAGRHAAAVRSRAVVARRRRSLMLPLGMPFVYRSYATVFSRPSISRASRHQKRLEILYILLFFF
jgi:hypothetical protein